MKYDSSKLKLIPKEWKPDNSSKNMIKITGKCIINPKEVKLGIPIELEHTTSRKRARHIALQHLCEFPDYYSKGLIPMEKKLSKKN